MTEEVKRRLEQANWKDISAKLLYYVRGKLSKFRLMPAKGYISGGVSAEDIVQDAITKTWTEERVWDPGKVPDLLYFLRRVSDSLLDNHLGLRSHEMEVSEQASDPTDPSETISLIDYGKPITEDNMKTTQSAETQVIEQYNYLQLQEKISEIVRGDQELTDLATAFIDEGMSNAEEIARFMEVDIDRVYRLKEKFKRQLRKNGINY